MTFHTGCKSWWLRAGGVALWVVLVSACQSAPSVAGAMPEGPMPAPCGGGFVRMAATLTLPPAESAPAATQPDKSAPLRFASEFPVGGGVRDIGRWQIAAPGWQAWRLRLTSEGASSLSLHFRPFDLPEGAALWVCAPQTRPQGPYTLLGPGARGGLWTPQVKGAEIWVEILVPETRKDLVRLKISEAFAGYR